MWNMQERKNNRWRFGMSQILFQLHQIMGRKPINEIKRIYNIREFKPKIDLNANIIDGDYLIDNNIEGIDYFRFGCHKINKYTNFIQCDDCKGWYHMKCLSINEKKDYSNYKFQCYFCKIIFDSLI
eukprot:TRINITY_DN17542_c0_g1_i1.p1 TRINITY_DN17542_c0_g1~~TRINITY_DN17542_c0_g1_i1.p1  ORF type:complete len:126 (+),score=12.78 TRINITY_DN17542_c0_g1_i1:70-447(+)